MPHLRQLALYSDRLDASTPSVPPRSTCSHVPPPDGMASTTRLNLTASGSRFHGRLKLTQRATWADRTGPRPTQRRRPGEGHGAEALLACEWACLPQSRSNRCHADAESSQRATAEQE